MKYPEDYINKIICGDCLDVMKGIPDKSVDLVLTSPPYDNLRTYNGYSFDFEGIAKELYRITKDGGIVVWVIGDATVKGSETGTSFRNALYFKEIGFNLHDTMIWEKTGMLPTQDRYYAIFEYMFVFSKGKPTRMNFIEDKPNVSGGRVQKKDACINKGKQKDGVGTFVRKEVGRRTNIWRISIGESNGHPAIFPKQLSKDHIVSWSNPNDIVLDPFLGSGTTAMACKELNRKFIGIDISPAYCQISEQRICTHNWVYEVPTGLHFCSLCGGKDNHEKPFGISNVAQSLAIQDNEAWVDLTNQQKYVYMQKAREIIDRSNSPVSGY